MTKNNLAIIFDEVFNITLFGYLTFLLIETISTGFVSNYFNLNYLLFVVALSGLGMVFTKNDNSEAKESGKKVDWYVIGAVSIFSAALIYYKTKEMGTISFLISGVSAVLVFLLAYLQFDEEEIS